VTGALLIIGATLLGLFCPRKLSAYFSLDASAADRVYISYIDRGAVSSPTEKELDKERFSEFFGNVKNINVQPRYRKCKCTSFYSIFVVSGKRIYEISPLEITVKENGKVKNSQLYGSDDEAFAQIVALFGADIQI
ncbi:MAG: hypothetical protein K2K28_02200, partial [Clostridia bacterium]|nr:hypothetical protein [Clostridia bacterium]